MSIINRGDDYFQAGIYTGNGSSQTISGLRFQPDFVWIKGRSGATDHALYDAVRGATKQLESNQTGAESTESTGLTAFTSDGFTLGSLAQVNTNAATYAYWAWKANGAGVSNTDGTITSTVSANTDSGFSIVTYTGTGSAATVGHGLGVAPGMVIVKRRNTGSDWVVWQTTLAGTNYLTLNATTASTSGATIWNSTVPTSTVFSVGTSVATNGSSDTYVAYCFAAIPGYSAFGSYTGNGSADGPFVYTGFRPAFVMFKCTSSTSNWTVLDSARGSYNVNGQFLAANLSNSETYESTRQADFLSNGFKPRPTSVPNNDINTNSATYIYAAFAENPFKYSLAR